MSDAQQAQIALVTGAAQGLGNHIAARLFAAGYRVVVTDINAEAAAQAAAALDASGERAMALPLNVAEPSDFDTVLKAVLEKWGVLWMWHSLVTGS